MRRSDDSPPITPEPPTEPDIETEPATPPTPPEPVSTKAPSVAAPEETTVPAEFNPPPEFIHLPLGRIIVEEQIRTGIDRKGESFQALMESIRQKGVLEPVLVARRDGRFLLISGERRFLWPAGNLAWRRSRPGCWMPLSPRMKSWPSS
jgi:hypothetical protein